MGTRKGHLKQRTDDELERSLWAALSSESDATPPPGFTGDVWRRIDAWESAQQERQAPRSILERVLGKRMRNGEPLGVLLVALALAAVSIGAFLCLCYAAAAHSPLVARLLQLTVGPNLEAARELLTFVIATGTGGLVIASLGLSAHMFRRQGGL
ncbi:MAG TPA: hypothetical protein PLZ61_01135, partial [Candidatus Cryosericum sp.]|nr:hypothetical protein [Candidatus Cryosericum sp.]